MARTLRTPISPVVAERLAQAELIRIGCYPGKLTNWSLHDKPVRKRGKRRNGQHRGHTCSRTSASGKKAKK